MAAAEALLALRALARDRVELELVTDRPVCPFRPAATVAAFGASGAEDIDLHDLTADVSATLTVDRVDAVAPAVRELRLASGARRGYDVLVLAVGARARVAVPGALTFRHEHDAELLAGAFERLTAAGRGDVVFAVPSGSGWPVPMYELALLAAAEVDRRRLPGRVTLVTAEHRPLDVFGADASATVARLLADAGVRVLTGSAPALVDRRGLRLASGGTVEAASVIAAPVLAGNRVAGVPAGFGGFVRTDADGRVEGLTDVFAAGDMTAFPVKHGGVAAQQADLIAAAIARAAGVLDASAPRELVLRTQLFGAPEPLFLEAPLTADGQPVDGAGSASGEAPWWPAGTLVARHLVPWMARHALAAA